MSDSATPRDGDERLYLDEVERRVPTLQLIEDDDLGGIPSPDGDSLGLTLGNDVIGEVDT
jgi:hypothetical protein